MTPDSLLSLRNVSRSYRAGEGTVFALRDVSLEIPYGEFVAVVGPSGSGKSTFLNLISGIDRPSTGEVWVAGERIDGWGEDQLARWRRRTLGIVFQFFQLLPTLTALENVLLPMSLAHKPDPQRAEALLERVGLESRMGHLPTMLSGGEQQRVAIARALSNNPPLLVADEPTGNLDEKTGRDIMALLRTLPTQGTSVLMVTHDTKLASQANRIVQMANGGVERLFHRVESGAWRAEKTEGARGEERGTAGDGKERQDTTGTARNGRNDAETARFKIQDLRKRDEERQGTEGNDRNDRNDR